MVWLFFIAVQFFKKYMSEETILIKIKAGTKLHLHVHFSVDLTLILCSLIIRSVSVVTRQNGVSVMIN